MSDRYQWSRNRWRLAVGWVGWLILAVATAMPSLEAQEDSAEFESEVSAALDRARKALLSDLRRTRGDALGLVCLAAVHDGLTADERIFARAIQRLAKQKLDSTYALALRLMVASEYVDFPDRRAAAQRDAKQLVTHQSPGGGFSYRPHDGWWDMSNTQYAALGMRAAASLGVEIPRATWRLLLTATLEAQTKGGGFTYRPTEAARQSYSSMTVAGIAVLELCLSALDDLDPAVAGTGRRAVDEGWGWLAEHRGDIGDRNGRHCLYFHYGLERAAILSRRDRVGDLDWYRVGAGMMLEMQRRRGGDFPSRTDANVGGGTTVSTAFAVLFLRRKFRRTLDGPTTPAATGRCRSLAEQATAEQIAAAIRYDAGRGLAAMPDLVAALRDPLRVRRDAGLRAVIRVAGTGFRYHPGASDEINAAAIGRIETWIREQREAGR